jgi:predicted PurR-regulated permease PerM
LLGGAGTSLVLLVPLLLEQLSDLQARLPTIWTNVSDLINQFGARLQENAGVSFDTNSVLQSSMTKVKEWGASTILSSASTLMQIGMALFLIPLITFFLLRDYQGVRNKIMSWLPNNGFELGWLIYYKVTIQLQRYLRGVMLQSTIIALVASIGFYLIGVEMAILFGFLTGIFNLIPYVGPLLALIPPLLISLGAENFDIVVVVGIPCVILLVQLIDNLIVIPSVIASTVNLHPLIVLLGIVIFGAVFGFIGMLIAIPVMSASKIIFNALLYGLQGNQV